MVFLHNVVQTSKFCKVESEYLVLHEVAGLLLLAFVRDLQYKK